MNNFYQDNNIPSREGNAPSGTPQNAGQNPASANQSPPGQIPYQQPVYVQPGPYGQPVYYIPVGQVPYGYPVQQSPFTQEQLDSLAKQYGVPPQFMPPQFVQPQFVQPQPTQPQPQQNQVDSGMRVLYQSEDFDTPVRESEEITEELHEENAEQVQKSENTPDYNRTSSPEKTSSQTPPLVTEEIEIEEETINISSNTSPTKRSTMKIEEMEMSTFELNSILKKQGYSTTKVFSEEPLGKNKDIPLNLGGGFEVEDTIDETIIDISSDAQKKDGKKKLPVSEIIRRCILGISLFAIVISAGMLLNEYRLSKENNKAEEGFSDLIISVPETETTKKGDKTTTTKENKEDENKATTAPLTPEQQWAQIQAEHPDVVFPVGIQLKYAKLYATNRDFVGYLEADGVGLSLPIVQTDNDSDYMEKNFYGKSTKYGCPFVTHVNNIVDLDMNTIIFGHHMNNGTVFGALDKYKTIDGFKAAPVINFNTLYKDYSWKVVAAFVTNAYEKDDNGYVFRYYFASLTTQDRFAAYLNEMSQRSLYDTGVDVLPTDKLLTLSTCSHEFEDARFVVVARLVRPGESTDVDISKATVNPSPRYPQAFYDKKKQKNPYKNASRWEVG